MDTDCKENVMIRAQDIHSIVCDTCAGGLVVQWIGENLSPLCVDVPFNTSSHIRQKKQNNIKLSRHLSDVIVSNWAEPILFPSPAGYYNPNKVWTGLLEINCQYYHGDSGIAGSPTRFTFDSPLKSRKKVNPPQNWKTICSHGESTLVAGERHSDPKFEFYCDSSFSVIKWD